MAFDVTFLMYLRKKFSALIYTVIVFLLRLPSKQKGVGCSAVQHIQRQPEPGKELIVHVVPRNREKISSPLPHM